MRSLNENVFGHSFRVIQWEFIRGNEQSAKIGY